MKVLDTAIGECGLNPCISAFLSLCEKIAAFLSGQGSPSRNRGGHKPLGAEPRRSVTTLRLKAEAGEIGAYHRARGN